jgi:hypothetical protein
VKVSSIYLPSLLDCLIFRPDTKRLRNVWPSGSSKRLGLVLRIALIFDLQRFWLLEKACGQLLPCGKINSIRIIIQC